MNLNKLGLNFSILIILMLPLSFINGKDLTIWISSYQDQIYYEEMGKLYADTTGKKI